jgi:uncharacterized membrane protein (UPF0127 family)
MIERLARNPALRLAGLLLAAAPAGAIQPSQLMRDFGQATLVLEVGSHRCIRLQGYMAETPEQRAQGLMFVESMPEFTGMLFLFAGEGVLSMWMQNTLIPLDMLFLHNDRRIAAIERDTVPLSTRRISSGIPVAAVLELNAGFSARWGVQPGDRLQVWRGNGDVAGF